MANKAPNQGLYNFTANVAGPLIAIAIALTGLAGTGTVISLVVRWFGGIQDWPWWSWSSGAVLSPIAWWLYSAVPCFVVGAICATYSSNNEEKMNQIEAAKQLGREAARKGKHRTAPELKEGCEWLVDFFFEGYDLVMAMEYAPGVTHSPDPDEEQTEDEPVDSMTSFIGGTTVGSSPEPEPTSHEEPVPPPPPEPAPTPSFDHSDNGSSYDSYSGGGGGGGGYDGGSDGGGGFDD